MAGVRIEKQKPLEDGATLSLESYSRRYEDRNMWVPWTWFGRVYSLALKHKKGNLEMIRSTSQEANADLTYGDFAVLYERIKNKPDFELALKYLSDLGAGSINSREFREFLGRI